MAASTPTRLRRLHALGITPYGLRSALGESAPDTGAEPGPAQDRVAPASDDPIPCVLLLPAECPQRTLDLIGRSMQAFGAAFARAPRLPVTAQGLGQAPPRARAYLAFGEVQARALGHVLDAGAMRYAEIVLLDKPEGLHAGEAKRRLWLALKGLRRRLSV